MARRIKVFLDTNVLLDVLCEERRPYSEASKIVFQAIKSGLLEGELTTQSFLDASYILCRGRNNPALSERLLRLMDFINVDSIDSFNIREALATPKGDFEDDAQYACAIEGACDIFLTHDQELIKQYKDVNPHIRFYTPQEFVAKLKEKS
ncbi:MAG: PIN domain-containing protein [Bacteroidales bacterium]|nr:PIN domain-containing protein [Bacteroidales bacterium]